MRTYRKKKLNPINSIESIPEKSLKPIEWIESNNVS